MLSKEIVLAPYIVFSILRKNDIYWSRIDYIKV